MIRDRIKNLRTPRELNNDDETPKDIMDKAIKMKDIIEQNKQLREENEKLRECAVELLNNYIKCPQNEHNPPIVEWRYIYNLRGLLKEIGGSDGQWFSTANKRISKNKKL